MDIRQIIIRLLLAILFGGIIGLERETANRPAGFRTHIFSMYGFNHCYASIIKPCYTICRKSRPWENSRSSHKRYRFSWAGTIITEGVTVRGLTTAASLWTTALLVLP